MKKFAILGMALCALGCETSINKDKIVREVEMYEGGGKIAQLGGPLMKKHAEAETKIRIDKHCPNGHKVTKRGTMEYNTGFSGPYGMSSVSTAPWIEFKCN
jgi:hypothetical protein